MGELAGVVILTASFDESAKRELSIGARPQLGEQVCAPTATTHVVDLIDGRGGPGGLVTLCVHEGDTCTITIDEMPVDGAGTWRVRARGEVSHPGAVVTLEEGLVTLAVP